MKKRNRFSDRQVLIKLARKKLLIDLDSDCKDFKNKLTKLIKLRLPKIDKNLDDVTKNNLKVKYMKAARLFKLISSYCSPVLYNIIQANLEIYFKYKNDPQLKVVTKLPYIKAKKPYFYVNDYDSDKITFRIYLKRPYFRQMFIGKFFPVDAKRYKTLNELIPLLEKNFKINTDSLSDKEVLELLNRIAIARRIPNSIVM
jgi:hypothetical protein